MASTFNPNDFILQEIAPPEKKSTILEYDSKSRMILVRVFDKENETKYNAIYLSEQLNKNILTNIPSELSDEKDKIVLFGIYDDGTFIMFKEKMKYDFATKQAKWVKYEVTDATNEDAKEIFTVLKSAVFIQQTTDSEERNNAILEILTKDQYIDELYNNLIFKRDDLLRNSDYRILTDYPELFEGEQNLWIKWRNELRECVKESNNFNDELDYLIYLQEFKWPVDPLVYYSKYPNKEVEYLSTDDQYSLVPEKISTEIQDFIRKNSIGIINQQKLRNEQGIPVEKQIYDIIRKYNLSQDLLDFDLSKLNVGGV
jgi:hypothetical protein